MPKVIKRTKIARGKKISCGKCSKEIKSNTNYFTWTFYKSSPRFQCEKCGYPKPSQLTRSKMSGAYAAIWVAIADWRDTLFGYGTTPEEAVENLRYQANKHDLWRCE